MKQSQLFTKTRKNAPADEVSTNAQLLIRAGYIHKEMAGVYSLLPLGLLVMNKIEQIIREEMNDIGGVEIELTALQDKNLWEKTNRWDDKVVDIWFKTQLKNGSELGLGFTHEEMLTNLLVEYISSYRDLPVYAFQFQTKFRNELRAKSGIMRGREFLMKDLYSFCESKEQHESFYDKVSGAYAKIFNRVGIGDKTYKTFASGGVFAKYSHEFQTLSAVGEDVIYLSQENNLAINKEVLTPEVLADLGISKDELTEEKAVEVGNIFSLGTRFSEALNLQFKDQQGDLKPIIMGSYGIGIGRLMGIVVELLADEKGIIWPDSIAPFNFHILSLGQDDKAGEIADDLESNGVTVLVDDRDQSPGVKFNDADLIGIPHQLIVSDRSLENGGYEYKNRKTGESRILSREQVINFYD